MKLWQRWRQTAIHNKALVLTSVLVAFGTLFYAGVAVFQVWLMVENGKHTDQQIGRVIDNVNWLARSADWSQKVTQKQARDTVEEMRKQTATQERTARAARKTAQISSDALYISERAYIDIFAPVIDISLKSVFLPITNTGHIPSGKIIVEAHQALYNPPRPGVPPDNYPVEWSWQRTHLDGIPNGNPVRILVPFKSMDRQRLIDGIEEVIIAGTISYADGFPNTPQATRDFCWRSVNNTTAQYINLSPCDAKTILPILKQLDGYPNNEFKEP